MTSEHVVKASNGVEETKESYVLSLIKNAIEHHLLKDQMINPITLNRLIEQWSFDYDMFYKRGDKNE